MPPKVRRLRQCVALTAEFIVWLNQHPINPGKGVPYFCHQRWAGFICERYIHSPHSTDFAGLFLPTAELSAALALSMPFSASGIS